MLTAVIDGEVVFGTIADAAVGRAAVTDAPDGTRWVGISAVRVAEEQRRRGHARDTVFGAAGVGLSSAVRRARTCRCSSTTHAAITLYESMGFVVQHRTRYVDARTL